MKSLPADRMVYSTIGFKSAAQADLALEQCYASGEVSLSDRPDVVWLNGRYVITLSDDIGYGPKT